METGWTFAVVTDTHLGLIGTNGVHNPASGDRIAARMAAFGAALVDCAFCLHVGDVIDNGRPETMALAAELMRAWPCPVYVCLGNHDLMGAEVVDAWLEAFPDGFPGGRYHYSFDHRGLHVAVLHSWWVAGDALRPFWELGPCIWQVPAEQLAWLERDLTAHADQPTVVVNHPLNLPLVARLAGDRDIHHPPRAESAAELAAVLARHPQVMALCGGHAHAHQLEVADGVAHVATGCVSEFPYEYRRVAVAPDGLRVSTHAWPVRDEAMLDPAEAPRAWVAGGEEDRERLLPWPKQDGA